jgi:hypothetical protein
VLAHQHNALVRDDRLNQCNSYLSSGTSIMANGTALASYYNPSKTPQNIAVVSQIPIRHSQPSSLLVHRNNQLTETTSTRARKAQQPIEQYKAFTVVAGKRWQAVLSRGPIECRFALDFRYASDRTNQWRMTCMSLPMVLQCDAATERCQ